MMVCSVHTKNTLIVAIIDLDIDYNVKKFLVYVLIKIDSIFPFLVAQSGEM